MKQLREFIYDKSDILVALVILLIAALVIFWRFEAIADYPSTLVDNDNIKSASESSEKHKTKNEAKDNEKTSEKNSTDSKAENTAMIQTASIVRNHAGMIRASLFFLPRRAADFLLVAM